MTDIPPIRFVRSGSYHVAYQVFGAGPTDILVYLPGTGNVEVMWEHPRVAELLERLARFARVMVFNPRGFGLSDPVETSRIGHWEDTVDDARAVMGSVESRRTVIVGIGPAATAALLHASAHPDTVSSLVLVNGVAKLVSDDEYPWAVEPAVPRRLVAAIDEGRFPPDGWDDPEAPGWSARYVRSAGGPGVWRRVYETMHVFDMRQVLGAVHVPTLCVATATAWGWDPWGATQHLGRHIHGAVVKRVDATASRHHIAFDPPAAVTGEIQRFVTGTAPRPLADRVLAAVLFTDIVGSTEVVASVGDAGWKRMLDTLDALVSEEVRSLRGRVIASTGDGHLATFDGPSRAIRCGQEIRDAALARLGLKVRTGVHIGEVELRGDDIAGLAVVIARRVCDTARAGQILVSHAVPPLVAGAGLAFTEHGTRELKGVPGRWTLHEVVA